MKALTGILAVLSTSGAAGNVQAAPIDDAVPYMYERCLDSIQNPKGLAGEMAGTRFTLQPYDKAGELGVSEAYAHPLLGDTRIWEVNEDYGDRVQLGCTMIVVGGNANKQFNGIARELSDMVGAKFAGQMRNLFGDYDALEGSSVRTFLDLDGNRNLVHVLSKGIPGDPSQGYILSLFFTQPK